MNDFKRIQVSRVKKKLHIMNPTSYKLIGQGFQGAVFQLSDEKCVKIYVDEEDAENEKKAYNAVKELAFVPKVFETGRNYMIIEYLMGPDLREYLNQKRFLPMAITEQILLVTKAMKRVGFTRIKNKLHHFIVTENEVLKAIDFANAYKTVQLHPIEMFMELKQMGYLQTFMEQIGQLDPNTHSEWEEVIIRHKL